MINFDNLEHEEQELIRNAMLRAFYFIHYLHEKDNIKNLEPIECFKDHLYGQVCFFEYDNYLIVSFQMTLSYLDVMYDLFGKVERWPYFLSYEQETHPNFFHRGSAKVHAGFYHKYIPLRQKYVDFCTEYIQQHPSKRIILTGHSLGGALSLLAAADEDSLLVPYIYRVFAFGSPEVGNLSFADHMYNLYHDKILRCFSKSDIVPKLSNPFFFHFGKEVYLDFVNRSAWTSIAVFIFKQKIRYYHGPGFYYDLLFGQENRKRLQRQQYLEADII